MNVRTLLSLALAVGVVFAGSSSTWAGEPVRVRGSTTVDAILMSPFRSDIEKEGGIVLDILTSNSGQGLNELSRGVADIAMISAPFADVAARLKETANRTLDPARFAVHELGRASIVFVIAPGNPITTLKKDQLAGILSGRIARWSEVGGPNELITVVAERSIGGMRTEIIAKVLGGGDFSPSEVTVNRAVDAPDVVRATPGAIGFISSVTLKANKDKVKVVKIDVDLPQTLIVVTTTEPKPDAAKAADAIIKVATSVLHD